MAIVEINYLTVFVAAIVNMAIGFIWYGPAFGKAWLQLMGKRMEDINKKQIPKMYAAAFIATLIMSYVLAHFVDYAEATTAIAGAQTGFWAWLGFIATVTLGSVLWEGKPPKLYILNNAYQLISLVIMGAILAVWV